MYTPCSRMPSWSLSTLVFLTAARPRLTQGSQTAKASMLPRSSAATISGASTLTTV